ncbi:hypothetical protein CsSME_00019309 [Camellia sinensis var. sinensis]
MVKLSEYLLSARLRHEQRSRYLTLRSGYTVKPFSTFPLEIFSQRDSTSRSPLCASNTRLTSVGCATTENKVAASTDSPRSKSNLPSAPNISHSRMAIQATSLMDFLLRASATTLVFPR